jgi:hypothetical protein
MPQLRLRALDFRMMVMLRKAVECPAKIAMTALRNSREAVSLLPYHDLRQRIFLNARDGWTC